MSRADDAEGIVLVIDVIRAFSVAAYAFAGGVERMALVRTVEDARSLRHHWPDALLVGEVGGRLIEGFDLNNSPSRMAHADVFGRVLIQRTGAGTQGAVRAAHADQILACALVNSAASATYAVAHARRDMISILPTNDGGNSEAVEDDVCADYLQALIQTPDRAPEILSTGLHRLRASGRLDGFLTDDSDFPAADVDAFMAVDLFSFVMRGERREIDGATYVDLERRNL